MALAGHQARAQWNLFGPFAPGVLYLGPEGGWTHLTTRTNTGNFTVPTTRLGPARTFPYSETTHFASGFNAGARGGYEWGPWRFEEEFSYRNVALSAFHPIIGGRAGVGSFNDYGHSIAVMNNVIYDFNFGWPITPHIGAGIGAVNVSENVTFYGGVPRRSIISTTGFGSTSGSAWAFGYQAIVGARYEINPVISVDVDYRYLATAGFTLTRNCPFTIAPFRGCDGQPLALNSGYNTNNFLASLTIKFGAPAPVVPPPLPPPPPPPVHQVYLVFFDWDKYNITPEPMRILDAAVVHWKAGSAVQIQVTGYTDLSGPAGYNQRLSERRANAVAVVLERLGIPRNEMVVAGRGMNDPRVPTAVGVREPRRDRVPLSSNPS
jgi:opacity protein-like surface antigen